jgi:hypothetical protein
VGNCTVTIDSAAFKSEETGSRVQQRAQRVIRGTIAGSASYASNGDSVDLASYFPANKYRVILNDVSNTGNRLGVWDQTNKKLKIYTALNTEAAGSSNQATNGIFGFIAIGE